MKKIYVAEDSPVQVLRLNRILLKRPDCAATFFTDGLEVYRYTLESAPHLLLLDNILPSLQGLAVTRLLKFHDDFRHIPVVLTSSITDPGFPAMVAAAGADRFLRKPFEAEELLAVIEQLLPP